MCCYCTLGGDQVILVHWRRSSKEVNTHTARAGEREREREKVKTCPSVSVKRHCWDLFIVLAIKNFCIRKLERRKPDKADHATAFMPRVITFLQSPNNLARGPRAATKWPKRSYSETKPVATVSKLKIRSTCWLTNPRDMP